MVVNISGLMANRASKHFVVCVNNDGYPASLETRKRYVMLPDPAAEKHGLFRIMDESGEDYLYPKALFRSVDLTQSVKRKQCYRPRSGAGKAKSCPPL